MGRTRGIFITREASLIGAHIDDGGVPLPISGTAGISTKRGLPFRVGERANGHSGIIPGIDGRGSELQAQVAVVVIRSAPNAIHARRGVTGKQRIGSEITCARIAPLHNAVCYRGVAVGVGVGNFTAGIPQKMLLCTTGVLAKLSIAPPREAVLPLKVTFVSTGLLKLKLFNAPPALAVFPMKRTLVRAELLA